MLTQISYFITYCLNIYDYLCTLFFYFIMLALNVIYKCSAVSFLKAKREIGENL